MAIDLSPDFERGRIRFRIDGLRRGAERFEYKAERWQVRFQSWPKKPQEGPALLVVGKNLPDEEIGQPSVGCESLIESKIQSLMRCRAEQQTKRGWHLRRDGETVIGWFDLDQLPSEGQKNPFAAFDLTAGNIVHRCQLFVERNPFPSDPPVERDWRRGASAGLPTQGKRR